MFIDGSWTNAPSSPHVIEPLRQSSRTTVFKTACHPFSGNFHSLGVPDETRTR
ncbi:MAG: hypothetical protein AAF298_05780 [Cyanobacteria bacterium P01_A01_bin.40]